MVQVSLPATKKTKKPKIKLNAKFVAWFQALSVEDRKTWLSQGEVGSKYLMDFDTGKSFYQAQINGIGLPGEFETEDEALREALDVKITYAKETQGRPVPQNP